MILTSNAWKDYELIDAGNGERLERWGQYILRRPDPQIIWPATLDQKTWQKVSAHFQKSTKGGGHWEYISKVPEHWKISYKNLNFYVKTMAFKHTGIFPEQASHWDWMISKIKSSNTPIKVLNLFAYTGAATVACASAGAIVCHIDAAQGMVACAKENLVLSNLENAKVRFIVDDVIKFVQREIRRGNTYQAIIMDPPSYGRGPLGEVWQIEDKIFNLVKDCVKILSKDAIFFLINSYTTGFSPVVLKNILSLTMGSSFKGNLSCGEVGIPTTSSSLIVPSGTFGKWEAIL